MNLAFTLCSNNYLAQAKILGDSLQKFNAEYKLIIGLVDERNAEIDYDFFPYQVIPVSEIDIYDFDQLWKKYNIVEFNTCVKASFFKYLFKSNPEIENVFYFDPDIQVFSSIGTLENELVENNIIITPHATTPITPDGLLPDENIFLNYGIYNLGFIGLNKATLKDGGFLDWWELRTLNFGYKDLLNGMFVDQLYINLAPLFFPKVKILLDKGYNMAPWNLHERKLTQENSYRLRVNNETDLVFYHFSSYKFRNPEKMSVHSPRYTFVTNPEMKFLYSQYQEKMIANNAEKYSSIICSYIQQKEKYLKIIEPPPETKFTFKKIMKEVVPPVIWKFMKLKIFKA